MITLLISLLVVSTNARIIIIDGLVLFIYLLLALLFLYVQLRVFIWAASGRPTRFFFGILGWAAVNGLIFWAIVNPIVLSILLVVFSLVFRVVLILFLAIIQFVALFWFTAAICEL